MSKLVFTKTIDITEEMVMSLFGLLAWQINSPQRKPPYYFMLMDWASNVIRKRRWEITGNRDSYVLITNGYGHILTIEQHGTRLGLQRKMLSVLLKELKRQ